MSDKLESKAVEVMDATMKGVQALAGKLDALATQYGPDVVTAGIEVARVNALSGLLGTAALLVASGVLAVCSYKGARFCGWIGTRPVSPAHAAWAKYHAQYNAYLHSSGLDRPERPSAEYPQDPVKGAHHFFTVFTGVGSAVTLFAGAISFRVWDLIGVFEPKLYIAYRLLKGVL